MEWLRLMKLVRWLGSTVLLGVLFSIGSKLLGVMMKPEPWYVQLLALILLIAAAGAWVAATWYLNRMVRDAE